MFDKYRKTNIIVIEEKSRGLFMPTLIKDNNKKPATPVRDSNQPLNENFNRNNEFKPDKENGENNNGNRSGH